MRTLGWTGRRHYDLRATFITLALDDGADPEIGTYQEQAAIG